MKRAPEYNVKHSRQATALEGRERETYNAADLPGIVVKEFVQIGRIYLMCKLSQNILKITNFHVST